MTPTLKNDDTKQKRVFMKYYDIDAIINHALNNHIDISPTDRLEWVCFCHALMVLGYDENLFVALSSGDEIESRKTWQRENKLNRRYRTKEQAIGMIVNLAKRAGIDVNYFSMLPNRDNRQEGNATARTHYCPNPQPATEALAPAINPDYLPIATIERANKFVTNTGLFKYLATEFGESNAKAVLDLYLVGASKSVSHGGLNAVNFPYIDNQSRVIDCKIIHYNPINGKRDKAMPITWAMKRLNNRRKPTEQLNRAPLCYFGEHLLADNTTADICIVESEKTALICAICYPQYIWLACGGKTYLNAEYCKRFKGRNIILHPDRDGVAEWINKGRELGNMGVRVSVNTTIQKSYPEFTNESTKEKCNADIADFIIAYRHGEIGRDSEQLSTPTPMQIFERAKANNPIISELASLLELELP